MELNKDLNLTIQQKERILEKIRDDTQGRNSFKGFLAKEFADENLLFVEAVEKFDETSQDDRFDLGYKIYEQFVKAGSDKEVNIDAHTRKRVVAAIQKNEIKKFMFKEAKREVLETLRDDNLIRYMKSGAYETYIKRLKEEKDSIKKASPGPKKTPKQNKKSPKKSPQPGSSPLVRPSPESPETFDDVLDLMFQVYEDVFEQSFGDTLADIEQKQLGDGVEMGGQGVTDFEMFLAAAGGEAYAGTPPPKKKKEKKEKKDKKEKLEKGEKGSDTPTKKRSLFQRMTDDSSKKKEKEKKKDKKEDGKGGDKNKKADDDKEKEEFFSSLSAGVGNEDKEEKEEKKEEKKDEKKGEGSAGSSDSESEVLIIEKVNEETKEGDKEDDDEE